MKKGYLCWLINSICLMLFSIGTLVASYFILRYTKDHTLLLFVDTSNFFYSVLGVGCFVSFIIFCIYYRKSQTKNILSLISIILLMLLVVIPRGKVLVGGTSTRPVYNYYPVITYLITCGLNLIYHTALCVVNLVGYINEKRESVIKINLDKRPF